MDVLMFGWEFPPHISRGLGTACYGIVKGLLNFPDVNIKFVVPKAIGDERTENIPLISASDFPINKRYHPEPNSQEFSILQIPSPLSPYLNSETYDQRGCSQSKLRQTKSPKTSDQIKISFSGKYGNNLFVEIKNYAIVAKSIARENSFNHIHAHNWLTFPAGIAAKNKSGKPLKLNWKTSAGEIRQVYRLTLFGRAS